MTYIHPPEYTQSIYIASHTLYILSLIVILLYDHLTNSFMSNKLYCRSNKYRITSVVKVETDISTSIA